MNEDDAKDWLREQWGATELAGLDKFVRLLVEANGSQNLVSAGTLNALWSRHIADCAQLLLHAPPGGSWMDIGSGGGLPGIVVAILRDEPILLVEPRRLRVDFLTKVSAQLGLTNVTVIPHNALSLGRRNVSVMSARAVSSLSELFLMQHRVGKCDTVGVYPKGRNVHRDLDEARTCWTGVFHVKQSVTDANAGIVTATQVRPR